MKPALLVFLAALAPAFSAAQPTGKDPATDDSAKMQDPLAKIRELRVRAMSAPAPMAAEPAAPPASAASPAEVAAAAAGLPRLYVRLVPDTNGYTLDQLTKNMNWTSENLGALIDFIHPWRKNAKIASPEQIADAHKELAQESAAATELIKAADIALAKGIPRNPPPPASEMKMPQPILEYVSRPVLGYENPTPEQSAATYAGLQSNVLGYEAALIAMKQANPSSASEEANTEKWLADARRYLAAAKQAPSAH
jgi:hypothetical protein